MARIPGKPRQLARRIGELCSTGGSASMISWQAMGESLCARVRWPSATASDAWAQRCAAVS